MLITVTALFKARTVSVRAYTRFVGSDLIQWMDMCVSSVLVLPCVGRGLCDGPITRLKIPTDCL
jgi:hypothetical protein